jgi:amino acid transporter
MDRSKLNYIIDALMFIAVIAIGIVGLLLGFVIPTGEAPQSEKYLWGLHRHDWGNLHLCLSLTFLALFIIHIILHWPWIRTTTTKYLGGVKMLWAFVIIPVLLLLLLWLFFPDDWKQERNSGGPRRGAIGEAGLHGQGRRWSADPDTTP